jgi:hypothetical protein
MGRGKNISVKDIFVDISRANTMAVVSKILS